MNISVWLIWALVAIACVIVEIFTVGFAVVCFAFGAVAASVCAACGLALGWQIAAFVVFTALAFLLVRPFVLKRFYSGTDVKTNADALIGKTARVSELIDAAAGTGRVAIDGDDWRAVAINNEVIQVGTKVEVVGRDSIVLTVRTMLQPAAEADVPAGENTDKEQ